MTNQKLLTPLFIIVLIINAIGIFNPLFSGDSALYIVISKSFITSGNWMDIVVKSHDWLDKPHFPFWATALSFKLFGLSVFSYKLVSFLFYGIGVFYTYKIAKLLFNKETAWIAILILSTAFHIIISNNDVRAETFIIGTLTPAMYYVIQLYKEFKFQHIILGALFSATAIMTKGVFILIPIIGAIGLHTIVKNEWKAIFSFRWIFYLTLTLLFTFPELYALYTQFDAQPEKVVFGQKGVSGIRFFFWDSQFGRFFNNGPIKGKGEPTFFLHTLIWAFAPWALIAYPALFKNIRNIFNKKESDFFMLGAFASMFLIFSLSRFQLPHYSNIIFPFLAIITAHYLLNLDFKWIKTFKVIQIIQIVLFLGVICALHFYFKPGRQLLFFVAGTISLLSVFYFLKQKNSISQSLLVPAGIFACFIGFYVNSIFYPKLLSYQNGIESAEYVNNTFSKDKDIYAPFTDNYLYVFEFYSQNSLVRYKSDRFLPPKGSLMFLDPKELDRIKSMNTKYIVLKEFTNFRITKLKPEFLNPETRQKSLTPYYLIKTL